MYVIRKREKGLREVFSFTRAVFKGTLTTFLDVDLTVGRRGTGFVPRNWSRWLPLCFLLRHRTKISAHTRCEHWLNIAFVVHSKRREVDFSSIHDSLMYLQG